MKIFDRTNSRLIGEAFGSPTIVTDHPALPTTFSRAKSASFDGVNDYVDMGNVADESSHNDLSISMWVKPLGNWENDNGLLGKFDATKGIWLERWGLGGLDFAFRADDESKLDVGWQNVFILDTWTHVVLTWDGSLRDATGVKLYRNGYDMGSPEVIEDTLKNNSGNTCANTGNLTIGVATWVGTRYYANDVIGDVIKMPFLATPAEVREIFNFGIEFDMSEHSRWADIKDNPRSFWITWEYGE